MSLPDAIASLRPFFEPRTVAVVGASRSRTAIGHRILEALVQGGYQGAVFPVNPNARSIDGILAYPSVRDIPEEVDLAVIATPPQATPEVLESCAARGVKAVIVITAGFAEVGPEGARLQARLSEIARSAGMRMIGPNCLGLINTHPDVQMNATFIPVAPPRGNVAMSSDSGALGLAILTSAARLGLGVSSCVSVGNRADVSSNDLLEYWEQDEQTRVILLYLESFGNPRRFARIARRVSRHKPIVAVKAGRTGAGRRAAGSHTAALAASETAVDALFHQTGILRVTTLEEMFDLASALGLQPLPRGRRVGILTNAGGPAILCSDACEGAGLEVPELSPATRARLAEFLPASAGLSNPVDMIASAGPGEFARAVAVLLACGEIDALVVIHVCADAPTAPPIRQAIQDSVAAAHAAGLELPVLACLMAQPAATSALVSAGERIPCFTFPEAAARVLGRMSSYAEWRARPEGVVPDLPGLDLSTARSVCQAARASQGAGWLSAEQARAVLEAVGLRQPRGGIAQSAAGAADLARQVGFPVAIKLASRRILHKSEAGGVRLGLASAAAVEQAFHEIHEQVSRAAGPDAVEGVLVQGMISGGAEVLIGMTQDPLFGALLAFGLGGIHVEILQDVCFRVAPLTDVDAREMVRSIRGYRLLEGYRGHPPADVPALEAALLRVSCLVEELPEIAELDLNPVFALPPGQGCVVADVRIRIA